MVTFYPVQVYFSWLTLTSCYEGQRQNIIINIALSPEEFFLFCAVSNMLRCAKVSLSLGFLSFIHLALDEPHSHQWINLSTYTPSKYLWHDISDCVI